MELAVRLAGLCLLCAALGPLLRRGGGEWSILLSLGALILGLTFMTEALRSAGELAGTLASLTGLAGTAFLPLYKTVGIALVVRFGAALCRDAGESALAALLEAGGALCALLCAVPLVRQLLGLLEEWL